MRQGFSAKLPFPFKKDTLLHIPEDFKTRHWT